MIKITWGSTLYLLGVWGGDEMGVQKKCKFYNFLAYSLNSSLTNLVKSTSTTNQENLHPICWCDLAAGTFFWSNLKAALAGLYEIKLNKQPKI